MKFIITGNIGSGKSTLLKIFKEMDYEIFNTDEISKEIFNQNLEKILKIFGTINRKEIRKIVFSDKKKLLELENIILPEVIKILKKIFSRDKIAVEIPTYFEHKLYDFFNYPVILAYTPKEICLKRASKRDSISIEDIEKIYSNQIDIEEKKKYSDIVVNTNQSLEKIRIELKEKLKKFQLKNP